MKTPFELLERLISLIFESEAELELLLVADEAPQNLFADSF